MTDAKTPLTREQAQEIIAQRAEAAGEHKFAAEVRAGAWDETNRADIKALMQRGV